jgi:hypothetical protein
MKLSIQGNRLYVDNLRFSHCEVDDGHRNKSFNGTAEPRYAHSVGRELLHVDGFGWLGAAPECAIRVGNVVRSDGEIIPCQLAEARLLGMANYATEQGKKITLEIERG